MSTSAVRASRVVVAHLPRQRTRSAIRAALPRKRWRVVLARTAADVQSLCRRELVDAVLVDVGAGPEHASDVAALAASFPTAVWVALSPCRPVDAPVVAQCAASGFSDVLVDGVDEGVVEPLLDRLGFTARFAAALAVPPAGLRLEASLQRRAWAAIVGEAGRMTHTDEPARALGVTREHLSRSFGADGAPRLKQVLDLVRLLAASTLAKSPGYDADAVCRVLRIASAKQLASAARRVLGARVRDLETDDAATLLDEWVRRRRWRR